LTLTLSKLARGLQEVAACLILCGQRESGWIIPDQTEYVRIPSLNSLLVERAESLARSSFLHLSRQQAIAFRRGFIKEAISGFNPDIIIVENLAQGMLDELAGILENARATKIFLNRGLMTQPSRVRRFALKPNVEDAIRSIFETWITATDRRICDLAVEYDLDQAIAEKLEYVGYISEPVDAAKIADARMERGSNYSPLCDYVTRM
jgi:predicted glycosyltransferase